MAMEITEAHQSTAIPSENGASLVGADGTFWLQPYGQLLTGYMPSKDEWAAGDRIADAEAALVTALEAGDFIQACHLQGIIRNLQPLSEETLATISSSVTVIRRPTLYMPEDNQASANRHHRPESVQSGRHHARPLEEATLTHEVPVPDGHFTQMVPAHGMRAAVDRVGRVTISNSQASSHTTLRAHGFNGINYDFISPTQEAASDVLRRLEGHGYRTLKQTVRRERSISLQQMVIAAELVLTAFDEHDVKSNGGASREFASKFGFDEAIVGMARAALRTIISDFNESGKFDGRHKLTQPELEAIRVALAHIRTDDPYLEAVIADVSAHNFLPMVPSSEERVNQNKPTEVNVEPVSSPTGTVVMPGISPPSLPGRVLSSLVRRS